MGRKQQHVLEEMVYEMLLRLPVKSLLRFKTVCKNWYNLIHSSHFINNHHRHRANPLRANPLRFLIYKYFAYDPHHLNFSISPHPTLSGDPPLYHHFKMPRGRDLNYPIHDRVTSRAHGPVNGFFLLLDEDMDADLFRFLLFNPSTRESSNTLVLPRSYMGAPGERHVFGFGFVNNSFKIVSLWSLCDAEGNFCHKFAAVYSSDTDSWKHFRPCLPSHRESILADPSVYMDDVATTHANYGSCYWLMDPDDCFSLLSFDMESERFREIKIEWPQIPNPLIVDKYRCAFLRLHNGYITMVFYPYNRNSPDKSTELWVMEEDGGCWTNYLNLDLKEKWLIISKNRVLQILNNNQLLIITYHSDDAAMLYDVNSGELRGIGITTIRERDMRVIQFFEYRESLASLKSRSVITEDRG